MGAIEDVRKVIQDLVTPDLKALSARLASFEENTKLKFDSNSERVEVRLDALTAKIA